MATRRSRPRSPRSVPRVPARTPILACCAGGLANLLAVAPAAAQPRPFTSVESMHCTGTPIGRAGADGIQHGRWGTHILTLGDPISAGPDIDWEKLDTELAEAALTDGILLIDAEGFVNGMDKDLPHTTIELYRQALKDVYNYCKNVSAYPEVQIGYYHIHAIDFHIIVGYVGGGGGMEGLLGQLERNNQWYNPGTEMLESDPLDAWDFMTPITSGRWAEQHQEYQSRFVQFAMQLMRHYYGGTKPIYGWSGPLYRGYKAMPEAYAMRHLEDMAAYGNGAVFWHHEFMGTDHNFFGWEADPLVNFQAISDGSVAVRIGNLWLGEVTGIDFTGATSMEDVATILQTDINDYLDNRSWTPGPTDTWWFHPGFVEVWFEPAENPGFPASIRMHVIANTDPDLDGLTFPADDHGLATSIELYPAGVGTSLIDPDDAGQYDTVLRWFDGFRSPEGSPSGSFDEPDEWDNSTGHGWVVGTPWYNALGQFATITPYTSIVGPSDQASFGSTGTGGGSVAWNDPSEAAEEDGVYAATDDPVVNAHSVVRRADAALSFGSISPSSVDGLRVRYKARAADGDDPYTLHVHLYDGTGTTPVHTKTARIFNVDTHDGGWVEGALGGIFDTWGGHVRLDNYTNLRLGYSVSHSTAADGSNGSVAEVDWVGGAELAIDAPIGGPDDHASYANLGGSGDDWSNPEYAATNDDSDLSAIAFCSSGSPSQVARGSTAIDFGSFNPLSLNGLRVRYRAKSASNPYTLHIHLYNSSNTLLHTKTAAIPGTGAWIEGSVGSLVDDWNGTVTLSNYTGLKVGYSISSSGGTAFALVDFVGDAELGYVPYFVAGPDDHELYDELGIGGGSDTIFNPDNAAEEGGGVATTVATGTTERIRGSASLDFGSITPSAIHGLRVRYKARRVSGDNYLLNIHLYDGTDGNVLHTKSVTISSTSWTEGTVGGLLDDWNGTITTSNYDELRIGFSVTHPMFGGGISSTAEIDWVGDAELGYAR